MTVRGWKSERHCEHETKRKHACEIESTCTRPEENKWVRRQERERERETSKERERERETKREAERERDGTSKQE